MVRLCVAMLAMLGLAQGEPQREYADPARRFRFSYPASFGEPSPGTNDGFGDRLGGPDAQCEPAASPLCRGRVDGDLRQGGGVCARRAAATRLRCGSLSRGPLLDFPDRSGRSGPRRVRSQPDDDRRHVLGSVLRPSCPRTRADRSPRLGLRRWSRLAPPWLFPWPRFNYSLRFSPAGSVDAHPPARCACVLLGWRRADRRARQGLHHAAGRRSARRVRCARRDRDRRAR